MTDPDDYVPSPCRRECAMDRRREYCTGCGRSLDEIARWGGMGPAERRAVWKRLGRPVPNAGRD